jgi:arylformamidase
MSDTAAMDLAYSNGAFIPGAAEYPARWEEKAARFRAGLGARAVCDVAYGPGVAFDLFLPEGTPKGVLVFVHGGYWLAFGRRDWSHLAAGALARGWACAVPGYTLAPAARISQMAREIATAVKAIAVRVPGPVVVAGHSAGGHLAARMACADMDVPLARVVPISPLADLEPIMGTAMNAKLGLDVAEVAAESPALLGLRAGVEAHVWVGGQERPAFLWQARTLSENWGCAWTVAPGQHHFDVIDGLENPDSALTDACLKGL